MTDLTTIKEAAKATGYTEHHIRVLCRNGDLTQAKRGGTRRHARWRVSVAELLRWRKTARRRRRTAP